MRKRVWAVSASCERQIIPVGGKLILESCLASGKHYNPRKEKRVTKAKKIHSLSLAGDMEKGWKWQSLWKWENRREALNPGIAWRESLAASAIVIVRGNLSFKT